MRALSKEKRERQGAHKEQAARKRESRERTKKGGTHAWLKRDQSIEHEVDLGRKVSAEIDAGRHSFWRTYCTD